MSTGQLLMKILHLQLESNLKNKIDAKTKKKTN
jgi:hypothetical protein